MEGKQSEVRISLMGSMLGISNVDAQPNEVIQEIGKSEGILLDFERCNLSCQYAMISIT